MIFIWIESKPLFHSVILYSVKNQKHALGVFKTSQVDQ